MGGFCPACERIEPFLQILLVLLYRVSAEL